MLHLNPTYSGPSVGTCVCLSLQFTLMSAGVVFLIAGRTCLKLPRSFSMVREYRCFSLSCHEKQGSTFVKLVIEVIWHASYFLFIQVSTLNRSYTCSCCGNVILIPTVSIWIVYCNPCALWWSNRVFQVRYLTVDAYSELCNKDWNGHLALINVQMPWRYQLYVIQVRKEGLFCSQCVQSRRQFQWPWLTRAWRWGCRPLTGG